MVVKQEEGGHATGLSYAPLTKKPLLQHDRAFSLSRAPNSIKAVRVPRGEVNGGNS